MSKRRTGLVDAAPGRCFSHEIAEVARVPEREIVERVLALERSRFRVRHRAVVEVDPPFLVAAPQDESPALPVGHRELEGLGKAFFFERATQDRFRCLERGRGVVAAGAAEDHLDPRLNLFRVDGLDHVVVRAAPDALDLVRGRLEPGEHDYRNLLGLRILLEAMAGLEPVHHRHFEVQEHERGPPRRDSSQSLFAVHGELHVVAPGLEEVAHHDAVVELVVDHQDEIFGHSRILRLSSDSPPSVTARLRSWSR